MFFCTRPFYPDIPSSVARPCRSPWACWWCQSQRLTCSSGEPLGKVHKASGRAKGAQMTKTNAAGTSPEEVPNRAPWTQWKCKKKLNRVESGRAGSVSWKRYMCLMQRHQVASAEMSQVQSTARRESESQRDTYELCLPAGHWPLWFGAPLQEPEHSDGTKSWCCPGFAEPPRHPRSPTWTPDTPGLPATGEACNKVNVWIVNTHKNCEIVTMTTMNECINGL